MNNFISISNIAKKYSISKNQARYILTVAKLTPISSGNKFLYDENEVENAINIYGSFDYYVWTTISKMFNVSSRNYGFKDYITKFIPTKEIGDRTHFDKKYVDDLFSNPSKYGMKINLNHYPSIYPINSQIDDFFTNYLSMNDFKDEYKKVYNEDCPLKCFNQLPATINVKKIIFIEKIELGIHKKDLDSIMKYIHNSNTLKNEKDDMEYFKLLDSSIGTIHKFKFKNTFMYLDEFMMKKLKGKKDRLLISRFHTLKEFLIENLDKEILDYSNEEIVDFLKKLNTHSLINMYCIQFINYLLTHYKDKCSFNITVSNKPLKKQKTLDDFYSLDEWTNYVNFIFDIELHIEKAFRNYRYAAFWTFCMLQCSLAWRLEDIICIPALHIPNVQQYSLTYFETHEFTRNDAWSVLNNAKLFIEQDKVRKTGAKKHFIIMNSFSIATAIGLIICEQFRQAYNNENLFGKIAFRNDYIEKVLGEKIHGFSNLKACRTLLSFANEVNSNIEESSKAINISSYMRSHKMNEVGVSNTTEIYLKSKYDERELLSLPKKMNEIGLFGWLYKEVLDCLGEKNQEHQIAIVEDEVTPMKLEGYSNFILNEQKNRKEVFREVMLLDKEYLNKIIEGKNISKVKEICCIKSKCPYPLADKCELCKYAIPTIHSLYMIGQETMDILDRLLNVNTTILDKNRYSYQMLKLLSILKEAKDELGVDVVSQFAFYNEIREKVALLQKGEKNGS